ISCLAFFFFFQAEDGIRDLTVTGVQTCALPIFEALAGLEGGDHLLRWELGRRGGGAEGEDETGTQALHAAPSWGERDRERWAQRSEERRVGKEGGTRGAASDDERRVDV